MAYVPVPKDLTHVRQKVLFNLTRRQLVCFLGGALVGAPLFYLLKPYVASSAASLVMVLVMIPFILLGVYEKNGEPLEVVLKHFFTATFLRPKKRPYQSENLYDALERQSALQKDVAQIEKKKKRKKLSREEKKLIRTKIKEADRRQETPHTAQKTIPYQRMYPDGICRVTDTRYTRTIQFQDINYQLSQNEDKQALFDGWCDFLNYFDPSIHFQFSFFDLAANPKVFEQRIDIPAQNDDFDSIRAEYAKHQCTRYYVDEMHLLLKEEQTAAYSVEIWKRFRKWGGIPTGLTQNVKDLLASREIKSKTEPACPSTEVCKTSKPRSPKRFSAISNTLKKRHMLSSTWHSLAHPPRFERGAFRLGVPKSVRLWNPSAPLERLILLDF